MPPTGYNPLTPDAGGALDTHLDVLVIGAGISGIATGHYLDTLCPDHTWAIVEARDTLGGTWDLFRYPGIRSDSDMFTLGFSFRPWDRPDAIADGPDILAYLRETAAETGVADHIHYGLKVVAADWSSADARWTVTLQTADGEQREMTCGFLWACSGYYRYDHGYTPDFPGLERFGGRVVHPQLWPDDLDVSDKRVVVIGSGATAVTLVPELSKQAAHVTMLQRSPTYVVEFPRRDPLADLADKLPRPIATRLLRFKNIARGLAMYQIARRFPDYARERVLGQLREALGDELVEAHFTPSYDVWDQRVCLTLEDGLVRALQEERVEVVTDHIETFTEGGIQLRSGRTLDADVVVTATGLELQFLGGAEVRVDGAPLDIGSTVVYRGAMLADVPNAAFCVGYTNASWTLKVEHTCRFVCRVLQHMRTHEHTTVCPRGAGPPTGTTLDLDAGYVARARDRMPAQSDEAPWRIHNNYLVDWLTLRHAPVDDGVLTYG